MAKGALAATWKIIDPKAVEANAAAQAKMPSMAKSFGAAPTANLSAADKEKAALEASKRSAAQPITIRSGRRQPTTKLLWKVRWHYKGKNLSAHQFSIGA